jgi:hypothetical protein
LINNSQGILETEQEILVDPAELARLEVHSWFKSFYQSMKMIKLGPSLQHPARAQHFPSVKTHSAMPLTAPCEESKSSS